MNGAQFIWGVILGLFGGFMAWTNLTFLLTYQKCLASDPCAESAPSSNAAACMNLVLAALLLWGAARVLRPAAQPSGLALWAVVLLCALYIGVPLLAARGFIGTSWEDDPSMINMIAAGVIMVLALKRIRG